MIICDFETRVWGFLHFKFSAYEEASSLENVDCIVCKYCKTKINTYRHVLIQGEQNVFLAFVKVDDMKRENEITWEEIE